MRYKLKEVAFMCDVMLPDGNYGKTMSEVRGNYKATLERVDDALVVTAEVPGNANRGFAVKFSREYNWNIVGWYERYPDEPAKK